MKLAFYIKKPELRGEAGVEGILSELRASGIDVYDLAEGLADDTGMVLSFGGDGSFLSAARIVSDAGVPLAGVNFGRVGFLADLNPDTAAQTIISGNYSIDEREMLRFAAPGLPEGTWHYALNEVAVHRAGVGMLEISVKLNGEQLPPYWADGLLVSTSSGSTAYSLSAGGPVCAPGVPALVVAPVAPHNLNVRPLVVPSSSVIELAPSSRKDSRIILSADNRHILVPNGIPVSIGRAEFRLRKVRTADSDFISTLREKLFWGEDLRNRN